MRDSAVTAKTKPAATLTVTRACVALTLLLSMVYFASYISRLNYAAVIARIVESEGILKSEAALATTASFITYGLGQLISGWLGDRISPKWLIVFGLLLTAGMNLLLPGCTTVSAMVAVWGVNGFAQSMLWPPIVRLMATYFDREWYDRGCFYTLVGSSSANILLYLIAPSIIRMWDWHGVFYIAVVLAVTVCAVWIVCMGRFEQKYGALRSGVRRGRTAMNHGTGDTSAAHGGISVGSMILAEGLIFVLVAIVMQGILKDGVTTWLPSYLVEVFRMDTGSSILSSVILPVFSILSFKLCGWLNRKTVDNEIVFSILLFGIGSVCALALAALFTTSAVVSVVLVAVLVGSMHGVNLMLICNLPGRFARTGRVSLISGVLNACTYVGSAVSTYGFALVAQAFGWRTTVLCWAGIAALGLALCVIGGKKTKRLLTALEETA